MTKRTKSQSELPLLDWAERQPIKPEGKLIKTDLFKWRMMREGGKAASVRRGEWPERAFWREQPAEIVELRRKQA